MKGEGVNPAATGHVETYSEESDKSNGEAVTERNSGSRTFPAPAQQVAAAFRAVTGQDARVTDDGLVSVDAEAFPLPTYEDANRVAEAGWEPVGYRTTEDGYVRLYAPITEGSE